MSCWRVGPVRVAQCGQIAQLTAGYDDRRELQLKTDEWRRSNLLVDRRDRLTQAGEQLVIESL